MFKNKQQVDKHVNSLLSKTTDPKERQLKAYQFAKLYLEVKDYASAKRCIETYIAVKSQHATAYTVKAEALEGLGDIKNALESYQHAYELDSTKQNILPKICHLICEFGNASSQEMKFWLEKCEKHCPNQKVIPRLTELLSSKGLRGSTINQEKYFIDQLRNDPTDEKISLSYLEYLMGEQRHVDALKFCTNIEYFQTFFSSLHWFETVVKCLQRMVELSKLTKNNSQFEKFHLLALCACLRLGLSKRTDGELQSLLHRLDISVSQQASTLSKEFLQEMVAQVYFYAACLLHKKSAISDSMFGPAIIFCYSASYSVPVSASVSSNSDESNQILLYIHKESLMRVSQAGHVLYRLRHGSDCPYLQLLEDSSNDSLLTLIFSQDNTDPNRTVLKKLNSHIDWKRFSSPLSEDLNAIDQELLQRFPSHLPLLTWILMLHDNLPAHILVIPDGTELLDFLLNMLNCHFNIAQFSCSEHPGDSEVTPESLGQLDVFCFVICSLRYCQATLLHNSHHQVVNIMQKPFYLIDSTEKSGRPSNEQKKYWNVLSGLLSKEGIQLGRNRLNLQRGLEQLRVGRLPLPFLLHIAHALDMMKGQLDSDKRLICSNWEEFFWKCSLQRMDRSSSTTSSRLNDQSFASPACMANRYTSLFPLEEDYLLEMMNHRDTDILYSQWRERAVLRRAELTAQRGHLLASVDLLNSSQSVLAAQKQGQLVLRSLQEEPGLVTDHNGTDNSLPILLNKAKNYFLCALDRLAEEKDPRSRQVLNEKILSDLEEVRELEDANHLADILPSNSTPLPKMPGIMQPSLVNLNTSNKIDRSQLRTPFMDSADAPSCSTPTRAGSSGRSTTRPTPERLESQLKMISHSHERVISQILDHNKSLQESNAKLNQLVLENSLKTKEATAKLADVVNEMEESRKLMTDLKRQMSDMETKWQTFSMTQQQQNQQLAAALSLQPTLITANIQQALQLAALQQQQVMIQQQQQQQQQQQRQPAAATVPLSMQPGCGMMPGGQQFVIPGGVQTTVVKSNPSTGGVKFEESRGDEECEDEFYYYEEDYDSGQHLLANGCWPYGHQQSSAQVPSATNPAAQVNQKMPGPGFFQSPGPKQPSSDEFTIGQRPLLKEFEKAMTTSTTPLGNKGVAGNQSGSALLTTAFDKPSNSTPVNLSSNTASTAPGNSPFKGFSFSESKSLGSPTHQSGGHLSQTYAANLSSTSAAETAKGLFSFTSPGAAVSKSSIVDGSPGNDAETSHPEDFIPSVDFAPIVSLPTIVKLTTGEENEKEVFNDRCQLFRFAKEAREWKTRGIGPIKILKHNETGAYRIIMRRDQVKKLCANHQLSHLMKLELYQSVRNAFMWHAQDYADGESKNEMFVARFKTESQSSNFEKAFNDAVHDLAARIGTSPSSVKQEVTTTVPSSSFHSPSFNISRTSTSNDSPSIASVVSLGKDNLLDKLKPKPGSWECPTCCIHNDESQIKCVACSTSKPKPVGSTSASAPGSDSFLDKFKPQAGSWSCSICMVNNGPGNDVCLACTNPRSSDTASAAKPSIGGGSSILKGLLADKPGPKFSFSDSKSNTAGGFSFGSAMAPVKFGIPSSGSVQNSANNTPIKSGFSFGAPSNIPSAPATTKSGFSFAPITTVSSAPSTTKSSGFSFGTVSSVSSSTSGFTPICTTATTVSASKPQFTFTPATTSSTTVTPKTEFSFVPISTSTSKPTSLFGSVTSSSVPSTTKSSGFQFGSAVSGTTVTSSSGTNLFGTTTSSVKPGQSNAFNWSPQTTKSSGINVSDSSTKSQSSFSFGASTLTPNKSTIAEKPKGTGGLFANVSLSSDKSPAAPFTFNMAANPKTTTTTPPKSIPSEQSKQPTTPGSDNELYVDDEGEHLYFKPLLEKLPEKVDVVTGEEKENILFNKRCRLYRWLGKEWKERGIGELKLLQSVGKDGVKQVRVVMRREQILKVCCNHFITSAMILKPMGGTQGKAWTWFALDYSEQSEASSTGNQEMFAARFKDTEDAEQFKRIFMEAVDYRKQHDSPKKKEPSASAKEVTSQESISDDLLLTDSPKSDLRQDLIEKARALKLPDNFFECDLGNSDREDDPLDPFDPEEDKALELAVKKGIPRDEEADMPNILLIVKEDDSSGNSPQSKPSSKPSDDAKSTSSGAAMTFAPSKLKVEPASQLADSTVTKSGGGLFSSVKFSSPGGLFNSPGSMPTTKSNDESTSSSGLFGSMPTANSTTTGLFGSKIPPSANASAGLSGSQGTNAATTSTTGGLFGSSNTMSSTTSSSSGVTFSFSDASANMVDFGSLAHSGDPNKNGVVFGGNNNQTAGSGDFMWEGQGAKLFSSFKPRDSHDGGGDSGDDDVEAEPNVHFEPIIPLPEKVKVESGEEQEECLFRKRARLYRFDNNQWKERGIGEMKIMKSKIDESSCRLLMRREQIFKVCCNHNISTSCPKFFPMSTCPKSTCWHAMDFSESSDGETTQFAIRFKNPEEVETFKEIVTNCQKSLSSDDTDSPEKEVEPTPATPELVQSSSVPVEDKLEGPGIFTKRVTLSVRPGPDQDPMTQFVGELSARRETCGIRVSMTANSGVECCNQLIKSTVKFSSPNKKPSIYWIADDPDSLDHSKYFHVMFSSKPALKEFKELWRNKC